jgi:hypothetical protein
VVAAEGAGWYRSHMFGPRWIVALAFCTAACAASGPERVRDIDGKVLPPSAVTEAAGPVYTMHCSDGNTYMVVTNPLPFFIGPRVGNVLRARQKSVDDVCDRILARGP